MTNLKQSTNAVLAPACPDESETWARRARIGLMEPDAALRSVLTRILLRTGCVVTFRRTLDQVAETLAEGLSDGVIVALDGDPREALMLDYLNTGKARLVMLTKQPADPLLLRALPQVRFHQKPFDVRLLLEDLGIIAPSQYFSEEVRSL